MTPKRRRFSPSQYESILARQKYICACSLECNEPLVIGMIAWDHCIPLSMGGKDSLENLQALIVKHHASKTSQEATIRARCDRQRAKHIGPRLNARDREIARIRERRT